MHPKCIQLLLESVPWLPQALGIPILHLLALVDLQITLFQSQLSAVLHCKHPFWRLLMDIEMCQDGMQTTKFKYYIILYTPMGFGDTSNSSLCQRLILTGTPPVVYYLHLPQPMQWVPNQQQTHSLHRDSHNVAKY
jgi:hypothetical protein